MNQDLLTDVLDLSKSENTRVSTAAALVLNAIDNQFQLSETEFEELLEDCLELHKIDTNMQEIEYYRQICKIYNTLMTAKSIITFI
jgi:hypothetical protein